MNLAIECRGLHKTWPGKPPVEAVRGIDLAVPAGICFGFLGPNGAGKTTTIEILEGLVTPTSGEVSVLGRHWDRDAQEIRQRIGVSLQETELAERLTVLETLRLFRSFYRHGHRPEDAIRLVALEDKQDAWVKKLSGGQKQRLAVATAIIGDADLIFLDEPTTGLDPVSRRQLWDIIQSLLERGKTVLLTTHYMDEAERLCDQVAIIDAGRVIARGTPRELIRSLGAEHIIEFSVVQPVSEVHLTAFASFPSVQRMDQFENQFHLTVDKPHVVLPALTAYLAKQELDLASLATRQASLEDVFVSITGRHLVEEA